MESQRSVHKSLKGQAEPHVHKPVRLLVHLLPLFVSWRGIDATRRKETCSLFFYSTCRKIIVVLVVFFIILIFTRDTSYVISRVACHQYPFVRWKSDNNSRHANRRYRLCILLFSRYFHRGNSNPSDIITVTRFTVRKVGI